MVAALEHVELSPAHLVVGLTIDWRNRTDSPLPIQDVRMKLYLHGRGQSPLQLYPLERFARVSTQRAIQKTPVSPFTLPPGEIYSEQLRFISQEVLDLPAGSYPIDIRIKDTSENSYTCRSKIRVENKIKYRRSEEWNVD